MDGSSGAPATDHEATFTENDGSIAIVDSDFAVSDPEDDIVEAVVTLTNGQIGDVINVPGALPGNISVSMIPATTLGAPGSITVTLTGDATTTEADWNAAIQGLTFLPSTNDLQNPNPVDRNFTFQVSDSQNNLSNITNTTIHVVPVNDAPTLDLDDDNSSGANAGNYSDTFAEDGGAVPIHSNLLIADLDDTNLESAQIVLTNPQTDDQILINGVAVNAGDSGTVNGINYTVSTNGSGELIIDLSGSATLADYDAALELITFNNTSDNPDPAQRVITVSVNDGDVNSLVRSAFIDVQAVNDVPQLDVALADQTSNDGSNTFTMPTASNFSDVDDTNLTYSLAPGAPAWLIIDPVTGVVSTIGPIPADASQNSNIGGGADGTYDITVVVSDPDGASAQDVFQLDVSNLAPVAVDDISAANEDITQSGNVITDAITGDSDSAPDGDTLVVSAVSGGTVSAVQSLTYGDLTINTDGSWTFVPNATADALAGGENAQEVVTYTIDDGNGGAAMATLTINITGQNDAPIPVDPTDPSTQPADPNNYIPAQAVDDSDLAVPLDLTPYFTDPDSSDTLSISVDQADLPSGMVFDPVTGIVSGTPDADASQGGPNSDGFYPITVTVVDGNGGTFTTVVEYTISNPAPIVDTPIVDQAAMDSETISIASAISDPDGDTLGYTATGLPAGLSIDPATGEITGTLDPSASQGGPNSDGVYTITVTADDNEGGTVTDTYDLAIT